MSLPAELSNFVSGRHFCGLFLDFLRDIEIATSTLTWTATNGAAPTTVNDAEYGTITMTSAGAEFDGYQFQSCSEFLRVRRKTEYWYTARFEIDAATQSTIFAGLSITDTTIITAAAHTISITDGIGLAKLDATTAWNLVVLRDSAGNTIAMPFACDTARHTYSICIKPDGVDSLTGTIEVYYDGQLAYAADNTEITALPHDEELAMSFGYRAGSAAAVVVVMDFVGAGCPGTKRPA